MKQVLSLTSKFMIDFERYWCYTFLQFRFSWLNLWVITSLLLLCSLDLQCLEQTLLVNAFIFSYIDYQIAGQIENPFGNDEHDLPLEYLCQQLKEDIEYIMESPGFLSSSF